MWCHTEELQENMTLIHQLENRVAALNVQHDAETHQEVMDGEAQRDAALKQESDRLQEEINRLRQELQEKHEDQLTALKSNHDREMERERTSFEKSLQEEREKLQSLQAALDRDESKTEPMFVSMCELSSHSL